MARYIATVEYAAGQYWISFPGIQPLSEILARMRHDGCGGRAGKAELLTGIDGVSSRPVRRIVLITNPMLRAAPIRW